MEQLHGTFREDNGEFDDINLSFDPSEYYAKAEPSYSDQLIKVYQFYQEKFGIPNRVFYPCCDLDASPIKAFPNSKVVLLDLNKDAMGTLNRNGIEALAGDVRKYRPDERFDLLILLNPGIRTKDAIHTVRIKGHIIANDYHENTTQMLRNPFRYRFEGTIHHGKDPMEILSINESRKLLRKTDPFFNLYSIFTKRF